MHFPLLQDILILLGFSVVVVFILNRFLLPSILGFLITGIIIGPHGLSLINAVREVELLSEIGVILLLFVIGMELSLKQLASIRKTVFIGGIIQVSLTVLVTSAIFLYFGFTWNEAVFIGFLFSLSSTAIVLKMLQDRNEISAPQGRNALGILIFQDIIVVPMMLVTPIMVGHSTNIGMALLELLIKSSLVIGITFVSARYIVPRFMYIIAKTKSKELFLLSTMALCFAVTYLTSEAGLSLALGAFLAGLIVSESKYSHHATSTILPFRELFTSFFFISVGMLLDMNFLIEHIWLILLLVLSVFFVKGTIAAIATAFLKYPPRIALITGLTLFQIGEFSFILSKVGITSGLLTPQMNQYFLSVSIMTMLLTPFVILYSENLTSGILKLFLKKNSVVAPAEDTHEATGSVKALENHLVIIGYGINGTNVAKAAKVVDIPYVIVELNAETVKKERQRGEPIIFGDAVNQLVLDSVQINKARVVVIAISDQQATKLITSNIRNISQSVYVVVRTRYVKEIDSLIALGADEVIPEEFETSLEIFNRVLRNFLVPMDEIENLTHHIRADNYKMFLPQKRLAATTSPTSGTDFKISCVRLLKDHGSVVGKTISEANIRRKYGINILAISRQGKMINTVTPDEKLLPSDEVFVSGKQENIDQFYQIVS